MSIVCVLSQGKIIMAVKKPIKQKCQMGYNYEKQTKQAFLYTPNNQKGYISFKSNYHFNKLLRVLIR